MCIRDRHHSFIAACKLARIIEKKYRVACFVSQSSPVQCKKSARSRLCKLGVKTTAMVFLAVFLIITKRTYINLRFFQTPENTNTNKGARAITQLQVSSRNHSLVPLVLLQEQNEVAHYTGHTTPLTILLAFVNILFAWALLHVSLWIWNSGLRFIITAARKAVLMFVTRYFHVTTWLFCNDNSVSYTHLTLPTNREV